VPVGGKIHFPRQSNNAIQRHGGQVQGQNLDSQNLGQEEVEERKEGRCRTKKAQNCANPSGPEQKGSVE